MPILLPCVHTSALLNYSPLAPARPADEFFLYQSQKPSPRLRSYLACRETTPDRISWQQSQQSSTRSLEPPHPPWAWVNSALPSTTNPWAFLWTNHLPRLSKICIRPPSLFIVSVKLKNFLSLRLFINVPLFSLADKLFLLNGLASGEAETSCPRTQSFFGSICKDAIDPLISEISPSLGFLIWQSHLNR